MKTFLHTTLKYSKSIWTAVFLLMALSSFEQNSSKTLVINHGGNACGSTSPEQHFFANINTNPTMIGSFNIGVPYYSVLTAYNPVDHKVYFADMTSSTSTNIYALDFNLGGNITAPAVTAPTYVYSYQLNQLCFDNQGNNYAFYNFDPTGGTLHVDQLDITTGNEIPGSDKLIRFPADNIPNNVTNGDVIILPNGRMFLTFGDSPSRLFEIINLTGPGDATAVFLSAIPRACFSIAYVDGNLMLAGSDGGGCYYYIWDINSVVLSADKPFPLGKSSADMTNMTLGIGCANALVNTQIINTNSARLTYNIVMKNKGNIFLNSVQLTNNLAATFGAGNISKLQLSFLSNPANLVMNTNYNGVTDTSLLASGQMLNNSPDGKDSVIIQLQFNVTNLSAGIIYKNSVISSGQIGAGTNYLAVSDSSNNGDWSRIDIDNNGVSDDLGENIPTPFVFGGLLPITQTELSGNKNDNAIELSWKSLTADQVSRYEIERSSNGQQFQTIAATAANNQSLYAYTDNISAVQQSLYYYRIKVVQLNQSSYYSNTIIIRNDKAASSVSAYPNPYQKQITLQARYAAATEVQIFVRDMTGRSVLHLSHTMAAGANYVPMTGMDNLTPGIYWIELFAGDEHSAIKVMKQN